MWRLEVYMKRREAVEYIRARGEMGPKSREEAAEIYAAIYGRPPDHYEEDVWTAACLGVGHVDRAKLAAVIRRCTDTDRALRLAREYGRPVTVASDESGIEIEYDRSAVDGEDAAERYVANGDWGGADETRWHHVVTWCRWYVDDVEVDDESTEEQHRIEVDAVAPDCRESDDGEDEDDDGEEDDDGHCYVAVRGPYGSGGGVRYSGRCVRCGVIRHVVTWATDPCDGTQGHRSVRYEEIEQ
jgi:hypothetical protein